MRINSIFFDANIILDLIDIDRGNLEKTRKFIYLALSKDITLFTSCDILTNIYYVARKRVEKGQLIQDILRILDIFEIIEINENIARSALVKNLDHLSLDFEDLVQLECAANLDCDLIVTNDKKFVKGTIEHLSLDRSFELITANSNII